MSSYYDDPDKITFDRAEVLVDRFRRDKQDRRSMCTAMDVASHFDLPQSDHNIRRLHDALKEQCEEAERSSTSRTTYKI